VRNLINDYRELRARVSDPSLVAEWVSSELPLASRGGWCLAMLDDALTDTFPGNDGSSEDFRVRLQLAVILLELAEESHTVQDAEESHTVQDRVICEWYIRFAREAIEKELDAVPGSMTPNAISRRALGLFQLTRQQAVMVAADQRAAALRALSDSPPGSDAGRPAAAEAKQLTLIKSLMWSLVPILDKVSDRVSSDEIRSWLDIREELALGPEVARLNIERMLVIARANRVRELRSLAADGTSAVEMACWLRDQLGNEFTPHSLSNYFEEAFGVDRAVLQNVGHWSGFGADGTLSDKEFSEILDPLIAVTARASSRPRPPR
jgi:hypothetical protein